METNTVPENGNDHSNPLVAWCLELDESWRWKDSNLAILSNADLRDRIFPLKGDDGYEDRIFRHLTPEERADLVYGWHLRGRNTALRDDAAKIAEVVHEAFSTGDLDDNGFSHSIGSGLLVTRIPLKQWWSFYRSGRHNKASVLKILKSAYEEYRLFSGTWFFTNLRVHTNRGGELRGMEAFGAILTRSELVDWLARIYRAVVASEKIDEDAMLRTLTIEKLVEKMSLEDLLLLVDALALERGLCEYPHDGTNPLASPPEKGSDPDSVSSPADTVQSPPPAPAESEASDTVAPAPPASEPPTAGESSRPKTRSYADVFAVPPTPEEVADVTSRIEASQPGTEPPEAPIADGPPPIDDEIAFDGDEGSSRTSMTTVEVETGAADGAAIVTDDELQAIDADEAQDAANGSGDVLMTRDAAGIDWGTHTPNPAESAADARKRIAGSDQSTSSISRAPTPESQRGEEVTAPSVAPPPADPPTTGALRRGSGPPPLPKPVPRPKR